MLQDIVPVEFGLENGQRVALSVKVMMQQLLIESFVEVTVVPRCG